MILNHTISSQTHCKTPLLIINYALLIEKPPTGRAGCNCCFVKTCNGNFPLVSSPMGRAGCNQADYQYMQFKLVSSPTGRAGCNENGVEVIDHRKSFVPYGACEL